MRKIFLTLAIILSFAVSSPVFADTPPPESLIGTPKNGAVFLQWKNTSPVIDHVIEFKESSSVEWDTYNHPPSSTAGIVIDGLSNNTSYDFRVSTISIEGASSPVSISSIVPTSQISILLNASNNQIISTGQSLAVGAANTPISLNQQYDNKMLNNAKTAFLPLVEPIAGAYGGIGETMSSGLANSLSFLNNQNYSSIISLSGAGGLAYQDLMQGTNFYNWLIGDVVAAKNLSLAENKTLTVRALTVIHGEADEYTGTTISQYEQNLVEWQQDYENDVKAITGQSESVPMFTDQMSSSTVFSSINIPEMALAQYNAAKNNPDKIILVTPKYIFDSTDWLSHLTNYSQRRLGEYYAKVYKKVIIDGEEWKPLMPEEVTINGNEIYAQFHVPVPPLQFDTTAVLFKEHYGFEYSDNSNSANITNVEIISEDTVKITLNTVPTGENPRLRYAFTGVVGSWAGSQIPGSIRGNLRDSDMTPATYQDSAVPTYMGNYLHNWALTFDEPILQAQTTPDAPTNVTATLGNTNGSAVVSFVPPANTGAGSITGYIVTSTPGNIVANSSGSPVTITGLSNNTTYTFTVQAVNQYGESVSSLSSNPVNISWNTTVLVVKPRKEETVRPITKPRFETKPTVKDKGVASVIEAFVEAKDTPKIIAEPTKTTDTYSEITVETKSR